MKNLNDFLEVIYSDQRKQLLKEHGLPVRFTPINLMIMERNIRSIYKAIKCVRPEFLNLVGLFLGETIIENINGATWDISNAKDIEDISVNIPSPSGKGFRVRPFITAMEFLDEEFENVLLNEFMLCLILASVKESD